MSTSSELHHFNFKELFQQRKMSAEEQQWVKDRTNNKLKLFLLECLFLLCVGYALASSLI